MTDRPDLDAIIADWLLADIPRQAPQTVLPSALVRVAAVGQARPLGGRRFDTWIGRSPRRHWAMVLVVLMAALAVAAVGGSALFRPSPALAPVVSNGWVAYAQHSGFGNGDARNGPSDIYLVRDGMEPLRIAGPESADELRRAICPSFSPDGTRLAYAESTHPSGIQDNSYSWGRRDIVIRALGSDGLPTGSAARITASAIGGDPCPEWSPDGQALAFLTGSPSHPAIVSGSLAVTQPQAYTDDGRAAIRELLATDVDGRYLAWPGEGSDVAVAGPIGLWLVPVGGGPSRPLASGDVFGPSWSPDGDSVAFTEQTENLRVRILDVLSGITHDVGPGHDPAWSPDGRRVAYLHDIDPEATSSQIVVVHADGSDLHVIDIASLGANAATMRANSVAWSPDGSLLLLDGYSEPAGASLLVSVAADGDHAAAVLVTSTAAMSGTGVSWQPVLR
jgi:dipeptidyl aminopeptidase/acylaminoacyl peptidase